MKTPTMPCLFEVDADGAATGTVHVFCAMDHRNEFQFERAGKQPRLVSGETRDYLDGSRCGQCGYPLS